MGLYEYSQVTHASPEAIWKLYEDVAGWSKWDADIKQSELLGIFGDGAKIKLMANKGPNVIAEIGECILNQQFVSTSNMLFGCLSISFHHHIEKIEGGTKITHSLIFAGCFGQILAPLIAPGIVKGFSTSLEKLAKLAESDVTPHESKKFK